MGIGEVPNQNNRALWAHPPKDPRKTEYLEEKFSPPGIWKSKMGIGEVPNQNTRALRAHPPKDPRKTEYLEEKFSPPGIWKSKRMKTPRRVFLLKIKSLEKALLLSTGQPGREPWLGIHQRQSSIIKVHLFDRHQKDQIGRAHV